MHMTIINLARLKFFKTFNLKSIFFLLNYSPFFY